MAPMSADQYPRTGKTVYLNIIWHQHQPLYLDPATDQLQGPWVRTHGTKDYYDMVSIIEDYPSIHFTVNLTSSLLYQLQEYYVKRMGPFVDAKMNRVNAKQFLAKHGGKTDPWIDLALRPTATFTDRDLQRLFFNPWNAFGVGDVLISRFPQYKKLRDEFRRTNGKSFSEQQLREVKFWFFLAYFDPDFLERKTRLVTGATIDLTDLVAKNSDGTYILRKVITEDDCNRIVAETYKVLAAIVPLHRKLMYHPASFKGQVEVITTPYYHPILPLIYDSDLAKLCQPADPMPPRFHFPEDADAQVARAVSYYQDMFGLRPTGMWPAEGAVAHDIVPVFARHGIRWIATDERILNRSKPGNLPKWQPYLVSTNHGVKTTVAIVFRDTELSDKIGFLYQHYRGEDAADDFVRHVLRFAPQEHEPDRLITVILDGENAWEWYRHDNDGKEFQHALYRKLSALFDTKQVITVTMTEYIRGNPHRNVPAHSLDSLQKLEWLWPGSWINANFDTWIGEDEENRAWEYLLAARTDLEKSGIPAPDPKNSSPRKGSKTWYAHQAWESMYAAEGSDWFWWYGTDQTAPGGDRPFDQAFITHLKNVYQFARQAGGKMPQRTFEPIIRQPRSVSETNYGTMAQSEDDLVRVIFRCDARGLNVEKAIFIAGDHRALGNWKPNVVPMYDDGTHGDDVAGDGIWSLELRLPAGIEIRYKYTNSGQEGTWVPGEEFPGLSRRVCIERPPNGTPLIFYDRFGKL
jgi:alpha-amylase/alpha-mannosidase (GH57 family)